MAHKAAKDVMLLIDGSVDSKTHIGFGAYLLMSDLTESLSSLEADVRLRRFENTSSTTLELQTLLWALMELADFEHERHQLIIYTDSQNIIGLPMRREKLENSNYYSRNNKRLNNYELYQQFYEFADRLSFQLVKVAGHKLKANKDNIDQLFTLVDRASRSALRQATFL